MPAFVLPLVWSLLFFPKGSRCFSPPINLVHRARPLALSATVAPPDATEAALLVHFRDVHPSFRLAEFRSVAAALIGEAEANGIYFTDPLTDAAAGAEAEAGDQETTTRKAAAIRPKLVGFAGAPPPVLLWLHGPLSARDAARVCGRCVAVRALYDVWGHGRDHEAAAEKAAAMTAAARTVDAADASADPHAAPSSPLAPVLSRPGSSWCVRIRRQGVGKAGLKPAEARGSELAALIGHFKLTLAPFSPDKHPVKLRGADHKLFIVEDRRPLRRAAWGGGYGGGTQPMRQAERKVERQAAGTDETCSWEEVAGGLKGGGPLRAVYFGRELHDSDAGDDDNGSSSGAQPTTTGAAPGPGAASGGEGPRSEAFYQRVVSKFSVKKRRYIGPTSMDAEMSFLMANAAGIRPGSAVLDPFCGTGGLLLAAAALGADPARSVGCDIDPAVLAGRLSARPLEAKAFKGDRRRLRGLVSRGEVEVAGQASRALRRGFDAFDSGGGKGGTEDGADDRSEDGARRSVTEVSRASQRQGNAASSNCDPKKRAPPPPTIEDNFYDQGLEPPLFVCADAADLPEALLPAMAAPSSSSSSSSSYGLDESGGDATGAAAAAVAGPPGAQAPRPTLLFDAIVTDPPYGKREWLGGRTDAQSSFEGGSSDRGDNGGSGGNGAAQSEEEKRAKKQKHAEDSPLGSLRSLGERVDSLMSLAARCLLPGGKLVFFLPIHADFAAGLAADLLGADPTSAVPMGSEEGDDGGGGISDTRPDDGAAAAKAVKTAKAAEAAVVALLPQHPELEFVAVGREAMAMQTHRLLITMRRREGDTGNGTSAAEKEGAMPRAGRQRQGNTNTQRWHWA